MRFLLSKCFFVSRSRLNFSLIVFNFWVVALPGSFLPLLIFLLLFLAEDFTVPIVWETFEGSMALAIFWDIEAPNSSEDYKGELELSESNTKVFVFMLSISQSLWYFYFSCSAEDQSFCSLMIWSFLSIAFFLSSANYVLIWMRVFSSSLYLATFLSRSLLLF